MSRRSRAKGLLHVLPGHDLTMPAYMRAELPVISTALASSLKFPFASIHDLAGMPHELHAGLHAGTRQAGSEQQGTTELRGT